MPSLRGLEVHVTDKQSNNLREWGVQKLRHPNGQKLSAYIQSTTGVQFHVSVQPRVPFFDADHRGSESETELEQNAVERQKGSRRHRSSRTEIKSNLNRRSGSGDRFTTKGYDRKKGDTKLSLSSPVRPPRECNKVPEYSFLASLYLDGRTTPERKIIVYTDPADSDFTNPHGKVAFRHRWVQARDGNITEHAWVFREKSIETVFDRLLISGSQAQSGGGQDEDNIIEALQSAKLGQGHSFGQEKSRIGQIVVEIKRVTLGQKTYDNHYRSKHLEGQEDDVDMDGVKPDITHATGLSYRNTINRSPVRVVHYYDYKPGEGPWATFQFFYRSAEQLQKFGFSGFPNSYIRRPMNSRLVNLTPLSISHPTPPRTKKAKQEEGTYEEKLRKKTFKHDDRQAKLDYGSEYRDASADDELEFEELHKNPAAPLQLLVPKAPRLGPQKQITLPGLPSLDSGVLSAIAPVAQSGASVVDPKLAEHAVQDGPGKKAQLLNAPDSDSSNQPKANTRRRPSRSYNPDEAPTLPFKGQSSLPTPTFPSTGQSSFPQPLTSLNIENLAKIRQDYRLSALGAHDSDADEEDAADEINTESDLETHAGDEEIEYTANLEEEEEFHDSLRSRMKNVVIRKRKHTQDDDDAEEVRQTSKKQVLDEGEDGKKRGNGSMHLVAFGKSIMHNDKKGRTEEVTH